MSRDHRGEDRRREDRRKHPSSRRGEIYDRVDERDTFPDPVVFGWWAAWEIWILENFHRLPFLRRLGRYGKTVGELEREKRGRRSRRPR